MGRPLFPSMGRIGQALSGLRDSAQQTFIDPSVPPTMMAGAAGVNPLRVTSAPSLVNTRRFSGPPSERPDWRDPEQQWDVRPEPRTPQTVGTRGTISTTDAIAQSNANMTDYQRGALGFLSLSPSSAGVVRSVSQDPSTGIAGGAMEGLPSITSQFPSQQYREPMAPVMADISGLRERVGVRTAYGMVYPTAGQESAAQGLAARSPMQGRLENVRAEMTEMTQAEKIAAIRQNARNRAFSSGREMEQDFKTGRAYIAELRKEEMKAAKANKSDVASSEPRRGGQTRQRSWSNYAGEKPIESFGYENEEDVEPVRRRRRREVA